MNNRLTYENYRGCKDIITIDLHNGYTVIAIKSWNPEERKYTVELRLKENATEKWDLIEKAESLEFNIDYKIINKAILKQVATLLSEGFFDKYIKSQVLADDITIENNNGAEVEFDDFKANVKVEKV